MDIILIIVGMALVTAVPRMLPAWLLERARPTPRIEAWLAHVPYAVLGALIFPGIMSVHPERPMVGLSAGAVAALLAWWRVHMLLVIAAAIGVVMVLKALGA